VPDIEDAANLGQFSIGYEPDVLEDVIEPITNELAELVRRHILEGDDLLRRWQPLGGNPFIYSDVVAMEVVANFGLLLGIWASEYLNANLRRLV
jgi:hypothetical protein